MNCKGRSGNSVPDFPLHVEVRFLLIVSSGRWFGELHSRGEHPFADSLVELGAATQAGLVVRSSPVHRSCPVLDGVLCHAGWPDRSLDRRRSAESLRYCRYCLLAGLFARTSNRQAARSCSRKMLFKTDHPPTFAPNVTLGPLNKRDRKTAAAEGRSKFLPSSALLCAPHPAFSTFH